MLIAIGCFVGVLAVIVGAYWQFVVRPERAAGRALAHRLTLRAAPSLHSSLLNRIVPTSSIPALARLLLKGAGAVGPLERIIERSAVSITLGQVVLGCACVSAVAALVAWQLTGQTAIAVGAGVLLGSLPPLALKRIGSVRSRKLEEQLPEAIDLVARALRAGHALTSALGIAAEEMPEPMKTEFRLMHDRQKYGMPLPDALRGFAGRVGLLDARFFVAATLTQREAGGNLSEVLDNLSHVIRERFRLRRQVRVISAHGRVTGAVLAALPIGLGALIYFIAPEQITVLFTDPLGIRMVAAAALLQVIGFLAMRRIIDIKV